MSASLLNGLVALLIEQLGHPHYHHRAKADATLHVLAPVAYVQLERATKHKDAEIAHRAWRIWTPYRAKQLERQAFGMRAKWPWIHLDDAYAQYDWLERAKARWPEVPAGGPEWAEWRYATRLWAAARLIAGDSLSQIHHELERMAEEERRWRQWYAPPP